GNRLEDGRRYVDLVRADAARGERNKVAAALERQRRADAAGFAEVGEPARQSMLERRAARVRRGDRRGRGRGEHRRDGGAPLSRELAAAAHEVVVAQPIDDQQHDVARLAYGEIPKGRVQRSAATG